MGCCTSSSSVREIKLRAEEDDVDAEDTLSEANIRLKAEARSMFAMVDDDGSGFLDRGELEKLIKMLLPAAEDAAENTNITGNISLALIPSVSAVTDVMAACNRNTPGPA